MGFTITVDDDRTFLTEAVILALGATHHEWPLNRLTFWVRDDTHPDGGYERVIDATLTTVDTTTTSPRRPSTITVQPTLTDGGEPLTITISDILGFDV